jgi:hypothetical protein
VILKLAERVGVGYPGFLQVTLKLTDRDKYPVFMRVARPFQAFPQFQVVRLVSPKTRKTASVASVPYTGSMMDAPTTSGVSSVSAGWFPVVTLLLGFAVSSVSDWFRRWHELKRDREARQEARHDQLSEQRRNFQRETLARVLAAFW